MSLEWFDKHPHHTATDLISSDTTLSSHQSEGTVQEGRGAYTNQWSIYLYWYIHTWLEGAKCRVPCGASSKRWGEDVRLNASSHESLSQ
eukprot:m.125662 g.125662  ORF g.125662 m.125662 type:complete len:89 (+) comp13808_c1_seq10:2036-2302(+)